MYIYISLSLSPSPLPSWGGRASLFSFVDIKSGHYQSTKHYTGKKTMIRWAPIHLSQKNREMENCTGPSGIQDPLSQKSICINVENKQAVVQWLQTSIFMFLNLAFSPCITLSCASISCGIVWSSLTTQCYAYMLFLQVFLLSHRLPNMLHACTGGAGSRNWTCFLKVQW